MPGSEIAGQQLQGIVELISERGPTPTGHHTEIDSRQSHCDRREQERRHDARSQETDRRSGDRRSTDQGDEVTWTKLQPRLL